MKGIYCYTDKKTNKIVYVGKDSYIGEKTRHQQHLQPSRYDAQPFNRIIQNNPDRYEYKVLKEGNFDKNLLKALEIIYIRRYNPKFNFTVGGDGTSGFNHSVKSKQKMSEAHKGKNNPMYNKHHSTEARKKMSDARKGKALSDNHKRKISEGHRGKRHSEETRKKISEAHKGITHSEETKRKIGESNKGKIHSEESCIRMSHTKNTTGYFRVTKHKKPKCTQGFVWEYEYFDDNGKRHYISSVDIKKLEQKVKDKGLLWRKL